MLPILNNILVINLIRWHFFFLLRQDDYKLIVGSVGFAGGWEQDGTAGLVLDGKVVDGTTEGRNESFRNSNPLCEGSASLGYNFTVFGLIMAANEKMRGDVALFNIKGEEMTMIRD